MTSQPLRVLLPCDHAPVPPELETQAWDRRQPLTASGDAAEINLQIESLFGKVFGEIDGRAADLIRIATFCYVADQFVTRGGQADVHREHWRRHLTLCIGVTDPAFWSSPAVTTALTSALAFATDDEWSFAFSQAPARIGISQLSLDLDNHVLLGQPDVVLLFSGGTDSLCALVDAMAQGKRPLVVSHTPATHIAARIGDLLDTVREHVTPGWQVPQLTFAIHRRDKEPESRSQRTRAFLYAALGAATALQLGLTEVTLADNGYVSVNPAISGQIVGAIASHGTHPTFLRLVNVLLGQFGDASPQVYNSLADLTRAEAFRRLKDQQAADLLAKTHTCGKSLRKTAHPHCGVCSQCVDRRFAFLASGLAALDQTTRYETDIFVDSLPRGEARLVALSYVRFAQESQMLSDEQLVELHLDLLAQAVDGKAGAARQMLHTARLLRRHADEVITGMQLKIAELSAALATRSLPEDGLLPLYLNNEPAMFIEEHVADEPATVEPALEIEATLGVAYVLWDRPPPQAYAITVGFRRLQVLVTNANTPVSAIRLARLARGTAVAPEEAIELHGGMEGFHLDDRAPAEPMTTNDMLRKAELKIKAYEQLYAQAIAEGDLLRAREHEQARDAARRWVKSVKNLHGRVRPDPASPAEKARKNVSRSIHDAIDVITRYQPLLALHLLETLHLGTVCSYHPDPPKRWRSAA